MENRDKDYKQFLAKTLTESAPPLSASLRASIQRDLNPSAWSVFTKLAGLHLLASVLTLSVCPQFGIRLLGNGAGLMGVFMRLGPVACLVACGAFFVGTGLLLAGLLLRGEELRLIRKHRWLALTTLVSLSLGFFLMLDTEVLLNLAVAWFLGALAGGQLMLEATWIFRFQRSK